MMKKNVMEVMLLNMGSYQETNHMVVLVKLVVVPWIEILVELVEVEAKKYQEEATEGLEEKEALVWIVDGQGK